MAVVKVLIPATAEMWLYIVGIHLAIDSKAFVFPWNIYTVSLVSLVLFPFRSDSHGVAVWLSPVLWWCAVLNG